MVGVFGWYSADVLTSLRKIDRKTDIIFIEKEHEDIKFD